MPTLAPVNIASDFPFSASIPFAHGNAGYMPQQVVSGPIAFSPHSANRVRGSSVYVRLIADGTNTPTFDPAFLEWGGSAGYNATTGIANQIMFWYDGHDYWYAISQAVGAVPLVPDPTTVPDAPTIGTATGANTSASVTFSAPTVGRPITGYTVTSSPDGITATGSASPITVSGLTNGTAYTFGVTATNMIGTSAASAASNSVTPSASTGQQLRLLNLTSLTESGTGPYSYAAGSSGFGGAIGGVTDKAFAANTDGSVTFTVGGVTGSGNEMLVGLISATTPQPYSTFAQAVFAHQSAYSVFTAGAGAAATNSVTPANGDVIRIARAGTTITASVSKDAGATWTTLYTWTGVTVSAAQYVNFQLTGTTTVTTITGMTLV